MVKKLQPGETAPFTEHLEELRKRLISCLIVIGIAFSATYTVSEKLLLPFTHILKEKMVFLTPTEAFFVHIKVALYAALGISVPMILYHAWAFLAPGLLEDERKYTFRFVAAATVFFVLGAAFCYYLVLPFGLEFLIGYGGELMIPMLSVGAYIGFCLKLMLVFGLVFQLPLVVVFLSALGLVTLEGLVNFRSYFVVAAFIIAAIITPPDVFTQVILSIPLILLYEMSIMVVKIMQRRKNAKKA